MDASSALRRLAAVALLAGAGAAQLSSSPGYRLDDFAVDACAGGMASPLHATFVALEFLEGAEMASPSYAGAIGFLGAHDPEPTNAPVVFAIAPGSGPKAGGTPVSISGLNFQSLGAGASLAVSIGGAPLGAPVVVSDTLVTGIAPALPPGPADVAVASVHGLGVLPGAWVASPAVTCSPSVALGASLEVRNHGPAGGIFDLWFSPVATSIPFPPFGTILIGPAPAWKLLASQAYPPGAPHVASFAIPNDPSLHGAPLHFQSVSIALPSIALTNRASSLVQ